VTVSLIKRYLQPVLHKRQNSWLHDNNKA